MYEGIPFIYMINLFFTFGSNGVKKISESGINVGICLFYFDFSLLYYKYIQKRFLIAPTLYYKCGGL